jgi:hypothetical protein
LIPISARAENPSLVPIELKRTDLEEEIDYARGMKLCGALLAALGGAMLTGAVVLPAVRQDDPAAAAIGLGVSSAVLLASGIPLIVIGAKRQRALEKKRASLAGVLSLRF